MKICAENKRRRFQKETAAPAYRSAFGGFSAAAYDLGTVYTVAAEATALIPDDPDALYFTEGFHTEPRTVRLIPYFMWGNRGLNQMRVWLPVR